MKAAKSKPGRLFTAPDGKTASRPLDAGATSNKQGQMWEVEDELGNKGWVSSLLFGLSK